ncbi:isoprenyl transferase [Alkalibacter saccharofermentans]|uniref:Isoprenyl transferase n=1 Tax=Alkalibacter saccharofermentans DSM 14828 TaxID=1120975 RepID=A0A1M4S6A4_9FIRM|nr:isoprenyl transferase [Alkalibacter saccharofermentans]SHE27728.1 undecaprenyl diphosphate synthase [Alkalibacter saccharofermentans DSM 14828]
MSNNLSENLPNHVGIIMDGNGRWAKMQNKPRLYGHKAGVETIREIVKVSSRLGIKALTLYAFSTENWKRPHTEVAGLMGIFSRYLKKEVSELNDNNVKLRIVGDIAPLSQKLKEQIAESEKLTKENTGLVLNIAVNYGGRSEVLNAVREIAEMVKQGRIDPEDISESTIEENLYTAGLPDPDFVIRTSGEMRLSNFLIWQCAYSELWFTPVLWPDFTEEIFLSALEEFQNRTRRFGGV